MERPVNKTLFQLTIVSLVLGIGGCCTNPSMPGEVDEAIDNWLSCEECSNEFKVVTKYCKRHVAAKLAAAANDGPPPDVLANYQVALEQRYQDRVDYAAAYSVAPPELTKDEYVSTYLDALVNKYKRRAQHALVSF